MRYWLKKVILFVVVVGFILSGLVSTPFMADAIATPAIYIAQSNSSQNGFVANIVERVQALFVRRASARPPAGRRKGGAGRGRRCPTTPYSLAALVPSWAEETSGFPNEISRIVAPELIYGTTIQANPTLLVYVPYGADSARAAKLMLLDENGHPVVPEPVQIKLPDAPGIISVQFPEVLEVNKLYNWYFSVVCDEQKPSRNPGIRGWIQRVEPDPVLMTELEQTDKTKAFEVYARHGIWFESVSALATVYRDQNDATVQRTWAELLSGLGLATPEEMPLADERLSNG